MSERKLAYELDDPRGYSVRCWYGPDPGATADVEIRKGEDVVREFQVQAIHVWNVYAHFPEIVDDLVQP